MPKNLLIVESPAKAKTIEKFLGKDFIVKSSYGHVRDLDKSDGAVDVDNDFEPKYVVTADKRKLVKELKALAKKSDDVWLATDEDREGEAISWHLCKVLGLDEKETKRITFREITKPAIQSAIQNPRRVDVNLVNAQQARRILDRLVGYELSGILWKKIRGKLSAGRVQSVSVKLIVEREREINHFKPTPFFRVVGYFTVVNSQGKEISLKAEYPGRYDDEKAARQFLEACANATFKIDDITVKPLKRKPTAPFTTSTLQQEASRKLNFSVKRTMQVAQRLYEAGKITYMRTDSINLSETALQAIEQEITKQYGTSYAKRRRFKSKNSSAQEAHEAIRPTYIDQHQTVGTRDEERLYELIWKRTIASQMAEAELEKTTVKIGISTVKDIQLQAVGEVLKFDGFLKVYLESKDDDDDDEEASGILPPVKVGQVLPLQHLTATQRFTRPPARYTEAGLVSKLEELGIGRPSTYAPTISKIMEEDRGYVIKENRDGTERAYQELSLKDGQITEKTLTEVTGAIKNRLMATEMGITVSDFLGEHFERIMNYSFTADIEKKFDDIALGSQEWTEMLKKFYTPFHELVEETIETAERPSRERILGKDPESGRTLLIRMSRRGPVVQIGAPDELEEGEKPRYANLRPGQSLDLLTYEEALELFTLPKVLGEFQSKEVSVGLGRFGPYVKHDDKYVSIPRGEDPLELTLARAEELILEKQKADAPWTSYKGEPVFRGKGRFGPFVKYKSLFVNIPRKYDPETLTPEQAFELIEAKIEKEANRYIHKWEDEGISVENGRWGPFIRFGKKNVKIPKVNDEKVTSEVAADFTLEQVKAFIEAEIPGAFAKKKKATKAKAKPKAKPKTAAKKK